MNSKYAVPDAARMPDVADDNTTPVDDRVSHALQEYAASLERGDPLSRESLMEKYADVAEELAGCLDSLNFIRDIAPQIAEQRPSGDDVAKPNAIQPRAALGDYRIIREIGRGGMGVVYEAEQLSLGRSVALKVLPYAAMMDPKAITRFKNEARAAATLDHPHIVPVFAVGIERGIHYYAMSLIDGLTVAELIRQLQRSITDTDSSTDRLSIDDFLGRQDISSDNRSASHLEQTMDSDKLTKKSADSRTDHTDGTHRDVEAAISTHHTRFDVRFFRSVARLGAQAAEALDHAHQHGIVHRDIKPGNLMIDAGTKLWVADFGLARVESDPGMTMTGDLVGTLRYMAPEQALAKRVVVDHRADVYALGATLYELLALHPTFNGPDRAALLKQIAFEDPKPLRQANRTVPNDLQTIVHKALSKNPDDRYQTAVEMADDLLAFVDDEPIKARPLTIAQRTTRWVAKRKGLVASVAGVLIFAVIGLLISNAQIAQQRNVALAAEEDERTARREADINARRARETVDKYLTKVSADQLLNEPSMQPLRKELLTLALDYYNEFVQQQPDDSRIQSELADAYHRVGTITGEIGTLQQSIDAFRTSLAIRENLLAQQSESLKCHLDVATSKLHLAYAFAEIGQGEKSLRFAQDAITTCERLVSQKPDHLNSQYVLAHCYVTLHSIHVDRGSYAKALIVAQKAILLMENLVDQDPKVLAWQSDLAACYINAGNTLSRLERTDEAVKFLQRSIAIVEILTDDNPRILRFQSSLASAYHTLASIHNRSFETADAVRLFQKAISISERLVEQNPDVHDYQSSLSASYFNLGTLHRKLGQTADASELFKKAITAYERLVDSNPQSLDYRRRLAIAYSKLAHCQRLSSDAIAFQQQSITIREGIMNRDFTMRDLQGLAKSLDSLGFINHVSGHQESAVEAFTKTIGLCENIGPHEMTMPAFWGYVGRAHYRLGNWQQARETLEKGIKLSGDEGPTQIGGPRWWYLTMTLHQLGEVELARSYYDQLVAEFDESPNALAASVRDEATTVLGIEVPSTETKETVAE